MAEDPSPPPAAAPRPIASYEARTHWARVLEDVDRGESFLVSRNRKALAVILPVETWEALRAEGETSRELADLLDRIEQRHAATGRRLDGALAALGRARATLRELRRRRAGRDHEDAAVHDG